MADQLPEQSVSSASPVVDAGDDDDTEGLQRSQTFVPPCAQVSRTSSGSSALVRTTSGCTFKLGPPETIRELQCQVCGNLIQHAVHAPCGHSFCQAHLEESDGDGRSDLEEQAVRLRELTSRGFTVQRARQALAVVGTGSVEQAVEMCAKAMGLEERAVRVKPEVKEPQFQWGQITHKCTGVVIKDDQGQAWVNFPEYNEWHCLTNEIEVEPVADRVRVGAMVKVRADRVPRKGIGMMEGDNLGIVVARKGSFVRVALSPDSPAFMSGSFCGYIDELEVVDEILKPGEEAIGKALERLKTSFEVLKASQSILAQLRNLLKQAESIGDGDPVRLVLEVAGGANFMYVAGCVDLLRAVGLDLTHWTFNELYVFGPFPGPAVGSEALRAGASRAREALLEAFAKEFANNPEVPPKPKWKVHLRIDPGFFAAGIPFDELWESQIKEAVFASISPKGESWSWHQRGWPSQMALQKHLADVLPTGSPGTVVQRQLEDEARKVAQRLLEHGLDAEALEASANAEDPTELAQCMRPVGWQGKLAKGQRIRFADRASEIMKNFDPHSIGIINGQVLMRKDLPDGALKLCYTIIMPKVLQQAPAFEASYIAAAPSSEKIQVGARVRVNPGYLRLNSSLQWSLSSSARL